MSEWRYVPVEVLLRAKELADSQMSAEIFDSWIERPVAAPDPWQPIDENVVPMKRYLVLVPPYGAMSGHFDEERWHCHGCLNKEAVPTHYMDLPAPPETE